MSKECDGKMLFNIKSLMLPLDSITEFGDECYAHLSEDGNQKETLIEHTERCQKYWFNIVEAKHIETVFIKFEQLYMGDITNEARHIFELMSVNVVTLHDIGKINPLFQKLKMKNSWKVEYAPESISSRHSIVFILIIFWILSIQQKVMEELTGMSLMCLKTLRISILI